MILQALYKLAEMEHLELDFEPRRVAWLIRISKDGELLGIRSTRQALPSKDRKKIREEPKRFWVPRQPTGRAGTKAPASFMVDNAKYVFGLPTKGKNITREEGREKSGWFRDLVEACLSETGDDGVRAVSVFLKDIAESKIVVPLDDECRSEDLFAFEYAPDAGTLVHERPRVREYWLEQRARERSDDSTDFMCLISGKRFGKFSLFPLIGGIPGASPSRIGLVSFNKNAFESYGLSGNQNAPISRDAAEYCATALNRLLDDGYLDPRQSGQSLPPRNVRLSADTIVCFWSPKPSDFCSVFSGLLEANPDTVKELYRSIWRGTMPQIEDKAEFYALTLSGTQGRAIVRDWFESTVNNVARNLTQHFGDLQIVRNTRPAKGKELPPQFSLSMLLKSLAVEGDPEKVPPPLVAALVEAALHGTLYPFSLLPRAVERARAEIGRDEWIDSTRRDARAALIKAVLNRRRRLLPATNLYQEVTPEMNPNNSSEGYALGILMAVLERLQQEALENVNASLVDRYFSGASASPKTVFVRLLKNARHHVSKAYGMEAKGGLVFRLERLIDEIADRFDAKHNGFPAFLNIEQQGLFILGYHQMRKWLWMTREERAEWESSHPDVPPAFAWKAAKE